MISKRKVVLRNGTFQSYLHYADHMLDLFSLKDPAFVPIAVQQPKLDI